MRGLCRSIDVNQPMFIKGTMMAFRLLRSGNTPAAIAGHTPPFSLRMCSIGGERLHPYQKESSVIPNIEDILKTSKRPYIPRRSLMYVPGNDERKLAKIPGLMADCICLDCEDGVAAGKPKEDARENIREIFEGKRKMDFGRSEPTVRVNSVSSGLCHLDVEKIFAGLPKDKAPSSVHLPKVDDPENVDFFGHVLSSSFQYQGAKVGLIMFIESARGLLQMVQICTAARKLEERSLLIPECVVFGSDDYLADIGATRSKDGSELTYARQKFVAVAKAFGLQAIDMVHIDYKDTDGLKEAALAGSRMGFTGKQIIHPLQIDAVNESFTPSKEKIRWAQELIQEFKEGEAVGMGAINFRGAMIDAPLVKQAQNIVDLAERIG